jgi:hypothetical protein
MWRCPPVNRCARAVGPGVTVLLIVDVALSMIAPFGLCSGRCSELLLSPHISFRVSPEKAMTLRRAEETRPLAIVLLGCCLLDIDLHSARGVGSGAPDGSRCGPVRMRTPDRQPMYSTTVIMPVAMW